MRRVMILILFFLLAAFGLYGVLSYTEMSAYNSTKVSITEPKDSLIAVEMTDQLSDITITSGETIEDFMRITNNVGENISLFLVEMNGFDTLGADRAMIAANDWSSVYITGNMPPGDYTLEIVLHAKWQSGSAEIMMDNIYVTIEQSDLPGASLLEESLNNASEESQAEKESQVEEEIQVEEESQAEDELLDDGMPQDDAPGENLMDAGSTM